jgi:outer membrane protein OmpA-like peptidoglycan-associated protein
MKRFYLLPLFSFLVLLYSCKDRGVLVKPKYKTTVFHGQQGDTEVNAFNRKQAEREKSLAAEIEKSEQALLVLKEQQKMFYSIDSSERIKEIDDQLTRLMARTEEIIKSLNETDPYTPEGHEKSLRLATELNDLLYKYVVPLGDLIAANKELKNIAADISFDTGSAIISEDGKKLIAGMLDSIQGWRNYLDNHDENVFSDEDYSTILIISGYSDKQGVGDEKTRTERNQALSEARAKAVAAEFEKQLKSLDVKWKLNFRISYEGKGEILPPSVSDNQQKNNPNRRVTTIRMVVGPKILLYNNGE